MNFRTKSFRALSDGTTITGYSGEQVHRPFTPTFWGAIFTFALSLLVTLAPATAFAFPNKDTDKGVHTIKATGNNVCPGAGTIWYVNASAPAGGTGTSWECAFQSVQDAADVAASGHEIWVAAGTYLPTKDASGNASPSNSRDKTFYLKNGVQLYGGFAGAETVRSQRSWTANSTILSGDIGTANNNSDNCYHVVLSISDDNTTVLDGFTVSNGYANTAINNTIEGFVISRLSGGGMVNYAASPTLANCIFTGNIATSSAGGMLNSNGSNPTISACVFSGNSTSNGGGMYNSNTSSPTVTNCIFSNNTAGNQGGGINHFTGSPVITNCTFYGNTCSNSLSGSAVYSNVNHTLKNCVFYGNGRLGVGGQNTFGGNSTRTYCIGEDVGAGAGNQPGLNPLFVNSADPDGADNVWATDDDGFHLTNCSPAINSGTNTGAPATDLYGNPRPYNGGVADMGVHEWQQAAQPVPTITCPASITVGVPYSLTDLTNTATTSGTCTPITVTQSPAVGTNLPIGNTTVTLTATGSTGGTSTCTFTVTVACPATGSVWYVDGSASSGGNGASWICAFQNLQDAIDAASSGHEIWVKAGAYKPTKDPFGNTSPANPRDKVFFLKNGVKIYGGFDGTETARSQRDWVANPTILSGDIGTANYLNDNCYHVVLSISDDNTTVLDGFTVSYGYATSLTILTVEGKSIYRTQGAGMLNNAASPTVSNCVFSQNYAGQYGGGMYNEVSSNPIVTRCVFSGNSVDTNGGAVANNASSPVLTNCIFFGNSATFQSGGMYTFSGNPVCTNCTFYGNTNNNALHGSVSGSASTSTFVNCAFYGNGRLGVGGQSAFQGSNTITYSIGDDIGAGTGNYPNTNPLFVNSADPDGADNVWATSDDGLRLTDCSPAINAGTNTGAPVTDLFGNVRPFGTTVDMGMHESQTPNAGLPIVTCPGNLTVNLSDPAFTLTGGAPSGGTYSGLGVSGGQFNPATAGIGAHTITYVYTSGVGCSGSCTFTITVNASVSCPANNTVCISQPAFTLTGGTPAGGTYSGTGVSGGTFNPAVAGVGAHAITYTNSGSCTFTITVRALPTLANAGIDQTGVATCGQTQVTLAANAATVGTGAWSIISGTGGSFGNAASPTSTFNGTAGTTYTLRWTISNAPCTASTDDVVVTFNRNPTPANAGSDQTGAATCGLTQVTLAANTATLGTGAWSIVSGTGGSFGNATSPTSTFDGTAGKTYTLRWTISNAPCTASTDDVVVTFNRNPTPANAGSDQTGAATCGLTQVTLAANAPTVGTGAWSIVSGTGGSFGNATSPTSAFDGTAGNTYTLRWTISNAPCTASTDDVVVTFNRNPTPANAGSDQTGAATCGLTQVTLAANAPTVGTGAWSIVSGTGGSFGNASSPTSAFDGTAGNTYTLRWTISNAPCTASTDDVVVTFNRNPTPANAGSDQTGAATCGLTQVTLAANAPTVGTGAWSIVSGTGGSFGNATSPTSAFDGTAGNTYTLRWTISNAPCTASTDDVVVTFNRNPTPANAGSDQTGAATCGLTQVTLAANAPTVGTGAWSIVSGTGGSFGNATSPTSTFDGTAGNTYTLRWTISNAPCTASTDDVVVTFNRNPTPANAGSDQTGAATCGLTQVTLAANAPTVGTGAWSIVSGTGGSFGNATSPTSAFDGTAGNTYTLRWTISNAPCAASTDDVVVTFNRNPTAANAGPDQTGASTCGLTQVTLAANAATVGTGAWSIISGTGGSFGNAASPTSTFNGTAGTTYTLRWTISNSPCAASTDNVAVTFNQYPVVSCPGNLTVNISDPAFTLTGGSPAGGSYSGPGLSGGMFTPATAGGGTHTITYAYTNAAGCTGSCTFAITVNTSVSCPANSTVCISEPAYALSGGSPAGGTYSGPGVSDDMFNPATAGVGTHSITYTNGGSCTFSIAVNALPTTSNAGSDQTSAATCGQTQVTLAANAPTVGTGAWSIVSGTGGSFGNASSPTSTFSGTAGNTYTLRWTISNTPCAASTDDVLVTFNQNPTTANAGPDQTGAATCGQTQVTLAANAPTVGTGAWSIVSGTGGSFGNASSPTSTFSGTAGNTYTLRWTISNSPCAASTDDVTITFNQNPTVSCPTNISVDIDDPAFALSGSSPAGGTYGGPGVSGGMFNPATAGAGTHTITYSFTNAAGCSDSCTFTITVDVNISVQISGTIFWEQNGSNGVGSTTLTLSGDQSGTTTTPSNGTYTLTTTSGSNFTVTPTKNINKLNGLTSADVTAIQQHVANNAPLPAPFKRIAADVNKSNSITSLDVSLVNQALLGNQAALNQITSWRFVPSSYIFPNPNVPWGFPEKIVLNNVSGDVSGQDFKGIKLGDVVSTWSNPANFGGGPEASGLVLRIQDQVLQAGQETSIEFRADQLDDLNSFQFALYFDPEQLQLLEIEPLNGLPVSMENFGTYNIAEGEIRIVWAQETSVLLSEAAPIFRLRFKALESGSMLSEVLRLNEEALPGHCYNSAFAESSVELHYMELTGTGTGISAPAMLLENQPNPFVSQTTISFALPESCEAQLRIFDASGRILATRKGQYPAGRQKEVFDLGMASGMLYYELTTPFGNLTKTMLAAGK